jgi:hypothetical protein
LARIRSIKPEIAKHEGLFELEQATGFPIRFTWALLPTVCDREGRFKWRPRPLKADILPYDTVDFDRVLDAFLQAGFLSKYRVGSEWYGWIPTFEKHQYVNNRETASELPDPFDAEELVTRDPRVAHAPRGEGNRKGREQEGNGDSAVTLRDTTPAALTFPTVGRGPKSWDLTEAYIADLSTDYPGIDVLGECRKALAWVKANQAKTAKGMPAFLVNWLNRTASRVTGGVAKPIVAPPDFQRHREPWVCPNLVECSNSTTCANATACNKPRKAEVVL